MDVEVKNPLSSQASKVVVVNSAGRLADPDVHGTSEYHAQNPSEVRYVACLTYSSTTVGTYTNGCDAVRKDISIKLVDLRQKVLQIRDFKGSEPAELIGADCSSAAGLLPHAQVGAFLNSIVGE